MRLTGITDQETRELVSAFDAANGDWSNKEFYNTMQEFYSRQRDDWYEGPFYLQKIPLSEKEFVAAQQMYLATYINSEVHESLLETSGTGQTDGGRVQSVIDKFQKIPNFDWEVFRTLYLFLTAQSKEKQSNLRDQIKNFAERGATRYRTLLKDARINTKQKKRILDGVDMMLDVLPVRAKNQFLWAFLRHEADADLGRSARGQAAEKLHEHYGYLGLTQEQIKNGLKNPNQADDDTAEEFGVSKSSIRGMIHRFRNPAK